MEIVTLYSTVGEGGVSKDCVGGGLIGVKGSKAGAFFGAQKSPGGGRVTLAHSIKCGQLVVISGCIVYVHCLPRLLTWA